MGLGCNFTTTYTRCTFSAAEAFRRIDDDIWASVASYLAPEDLLPVRLVSKEWRRITSGASIWEDKLTTLIIQYPALARLDQGAEESIFSWYGRCRGLLGDINVHAARHRRGEYPYLELYGKVEGSNFSPFGKVQFPVEWGFISELVNLLLTRDPVPADAFFDAAGFFDVLPGVQLDGSFRLIDKNIKKEMRAASAGNLKRLPTLLSNLYAPKVLVALSPAAAPSPQPTSPSPTCELRPAPLLCPAAASAGANRLRLRLQRVGLELRRAAEEVKQLRTENIHLRLKVEIGRAHV